MKSCSFCTRDATHYPELAYHEKDGIGRMRVLLNRPVCDEHLLAVLEHVRTQARFAEDRFVFRGRFGADPDDDKTLMRWRPISSLSLSELAQVKAWDEKARGVARGPTLIEAERKIELVEFCESELDRLFPREDVS